MPQDNPFPNLGGLTFSEDVFYRILDDLLAVGVVGATDYQVIQNHLGANMSIDVQPGSAYVGFTSVAGGKRRTRLPAQSNSGTPGSPNSADKWLTTFVAADVTNPRIDRVVLTVRDTSLDGSGASDSALRVIAGTPTAGATTVNLNGAAAVPANSILLANVLVPANATTVITANIADVRTRAAIGTGNVLLSNTGPKITSGLWSAGPPGSPADGDIWVALAADTGSLATTQGLAWAFRFNASSGSTYKWERVWGAPYWKTLLATGNTLTAGSLDFSILTSARAGDYELTAELTIQSSANNVVEGWYDVSGTKTFMQANLWYGISFFEAHYADPVLAVPAGATVGFRVAPNTGGGSTYSDLRASLIPKRII